ncbi:hypothetical protein SAMN05428957_104159 [Oryzisolibacter propanilivorax]|uniref:AB hydrolase-1 domain-containing protein n=1 Tax=Oryzisolibacter propanilivorax TaxID=1527607 RepID=A0A1G9S7R1_9BURK|nr:hypothetical protein SAMN05428957_104159 [Oryzisolibacter propanilivorax]
MKQISNARWQRWLVAWHFVLLALWMAWAWRLSPWLAAAGWLLVPLASRLCMLPQFLVMARVRRQAGEAPPGAAALARAWWAEAAWAARVFGWWQPFRAQAVPDWLPAPGTPGSGARGVVLVHGFLCNRGFWQPWQRLLRARGHPHVVMTLEPAFGSIDGYAAAIDAAVRCMAEATGQPPLVLAHSMGGLAVRAWLRAMPDAQARVHRVVTIGTPHRGTWAARHAQGPSGMQMRLDSPWLCQLAQDEPPARRRLFVCWRSGCDNVVYPDTAARLEGAEEHRLEAPAHVELAFDKRVVQHTLGLLEL